MKLFFSHSFWKSKYSHVEQPHLERCQRDTIPFALYHIIDCLSENKLSGKRRQPTNLEHLSPHPDLLAAIWVARIIKKGSSPPRQHRNRNLLTSSNAHSRLSREWDAIKTKGRTLFVNLHPRQKPSDFRARFVLFFFVAVLLHLTEVRTRAASSLEQLTKYHCVPPRWAQI